MNTSNADLFQKLSMQAMGLTFEAMAVFGASRAELRQVEQEALKLNKRLASIETKLRKAGDEVGATRAAQIARTAMSAAGMARQKAA